MRHSEAAKYVRGFVFILALLLPLISAGCGYHIAGKSGFMPEGVADITIPVFINATGKPDIEGIMTSAIVAEFVTTVDVTKEAGARIDGVIKSYNLRGVSFTESDVTEEYRLTVALSIIMRDKTDGHILWEDRNVRDYEDFRIDAADVTRTNEVEKEAFRKLSKDIARRIKERMLDGF